MKAIRVHEFGEAEVMQLEDLPDPQPAPGQVVVDVEAAGVNPVDAYVRAGIHMLKPVLPYTPGMDCAGTVAAIGDGVAGIEVGQRVYSAGTLTGAYAEKTVCAEPQVFALPDSLSFAQGAALGIPYGTAYYALHLRAGAKPGDTVLVHGASGGVGIAAIQMAKSAGMTVIGTGGSEVSEQLIYDQGADHVLNHHAPEHFDEILSLTQGRGVDVVLEMLANVNLGNDLSILALGGRVIVIGSRGRVEIDARDLMGRNGDIRGMTLMHMTGSERADVYRAIGEGLADGTLVPRVSREYPLAEAGLAHRDVLETSTHGKLVLVP
ncbi:MAG: NADPH:quinone reductase [Candidatus Hydrogenedentes bacterium]|nr:NADPH:quinone reductase [Candidatus Hydrogenedentota bacterium]